MDLALTGQRAVVFGAARGIGAAIADAFLQAGCVVHQVDRDWETKPATMQGRESSTTSRIRLDVTDYQAVLRCAQQIGTVQHVVFAVGQGSGKVGFPFWNLSPMDWTDVWQTNLLGAVHVAHAFAPSLSAQGEGTILFLTSVAGQIGSQTDPPYSAAKAALINFTQCAAKDLAAYGVRVNAIAPGMVQTALNRSVWEASQVPLAADQRVSYERWAEEKIRRVAPLGRWQTAEECAAMAVFLASPHARNITGQTLNIDGGQVMR